MYTGSATFSRARLVAAAGDDRGAIRGAVGGGMAPGVPVRLDGGVAAAGAESLVCNDMRLPMSD
jgi:hypothetical protein